MRNGSVAIVPILIAVLSLFWFIWFMGGADDNLHKVSEIENLQHLQERLLPAAMKRYVELRAAYIEAGQTEALAESNAKTDTDLYIHNMMKNNKIDD